MTPPLPRFHKLPGDKQRAILDAAAAEFAEHGFEGASFNRIIAEAGISKGAMYYYFADKADAYGAVLDDAMARIEAIVADLPRPVKREDFWPTIAAGLGRLEQTLFADAQLAALARGLYRSGPGAQGTYRRLMAQSAAWIEDLLVLGQSFGAIRDDLPRELLVEAVTGMLVAVDRWFAEALAEGPSEELMALGPKVLDLVRDLLEPKNDKGPTP